MAFFDDVTLHSRVFCQDITSSSPSNAIINKSSLEGGGFIGYGSFVLDIEKLLSTLSKQKFDSDISILVAKANPRNLNVIHKDCLLVCKVSFTTVGNDHKLEITFKNTLPNGIYSYEFNIILCNAKSFDVYMIFDV